MPAKKATQMPFIQSLDRGLTILQAVALAKQPVSLGELAELLGVDRSSAFRLAHTLRRRGFLSCPANRKDYILGSAMWYLTHHYDWNNMLAQVANRQLKLLATQLNETAHLAIREGKSALFIDSAAVNHVLAVSGQAGELVPLYCTAHGKALLADADEAELKSIFGSGPLPRHTKSTITSLSALAQDCALVRKRGYATDDAEYREELRCMEAPIRVEDDVIVGSIGVSAPMSRFVKDRSRAYSERICKVAQEIGILMSSTKQKSRRAS